jgi:SM-20-related protein
LGSFRQPSACYASGMAGLDLMLNPALDRAAIAQALEAGRRVHVPDILTAAAADALHACLVAESTWNLVLLAGRKHYDLNAAATEAMPADKLQPILEAVHREARDSFGYMFENFPIYDVWHSGSLPEHPLMPVHAFLNSPPFLTFVREITGDREIAFADAQATRYRAGHFLTAHDDNAPGKHRRAAYVLNLTRDWRSDWGGQLLFHDPSGHVSGGYTPAYNALNIFLVPQPHSVSVVAPFVRGSRYAITGWLRAGKDPGPGAE